MCRWCQRAARREKPLAGPRSVASRELGSEHAAPIRGRYHSLPDYVLLRIIHLKPQKMGVFVPWGCFYVSQAVVSRPSYTDSMTASLTTFITNLTTRFAIRKYRTVFEFGSDSSSVRSSVATIRVCRGFGTDGASDLADPDKRIDAARPTKEYVLRGESSQRASTHGKTGTNPRNRRLESVARFGFSSNHSICRRRSRPQDGAFPRDL